MLDIDVPGYHTLSVKFSDFNSDITSLEGATTYQLNIDSNKRINDNKVPEITLSEESSVEVDITLNVPEQAEIWLNRVKMGKSSWSGQLATGTYQIETRLPNRPAKKQTITITANGPHSFQLEAPDPIKQYLGFRIFPETAQLTVDGISWPLDNGNAKRLVDVGTHSYRITAADYHPSEGIITVSESDKVAKCNLNLKPTFGWLDVNLATQGMGHLVSVDNKFIGRGPIKHYQLPSGKHKLHIISSNGHKPFEKTFKITEGETTPINVRLNSSSSNVPSQKSTTNPQYSSAQSDLDSDNNPVYIQAGYQLGYIPGFNINAGLNYFANIELDFTLGNARVVKVDSEDYYYSSKIFEAKLGFGINIDHGTVDMCSGQPSGLRIIPQIGVGALSIHTKPKGLIRKAQTTDFIMGSFDIRFDYAFNKYIGIDLTPQINFALNDWHTLNKAVAQELTNQKSKVGFIARFGLYFSF